MSHRGIFNKTHLSLFTKASVIISGGVWCKAVATAKLRYSETSCSVVGQRWGRARQSMWRQLDVRACAPDHPAPVCDQFVRTRPTHSTARTRLVLRRAPSAWYRASSRRPDAARSCVGAIRAGAIRAGAFVRVLSRWSRYTHPVNYDQTDQEHQQRAVRCRP